MIKSRVTFLLCFSIVTFLAAAQDGPWIKPDSLYKFVQPVASLQMWSTYTMGEKAQIVPKGPLDPIQDRLSFMARRARIGFKGKPYKGISYVLTIQYDNLGKDRFSAPRGGTNTGQLGILDAYVSWRMTKNDLATLTTGFLQPQMSRECITGDMLINSFDKSPSQAYIRQHITGKGYGRTTGVNVGGMKSINDKLSWNYNVGLFNNNTTSADPKALPETTGVNWSPLTVERFTFTIGDPETKNYAINYDVNNYFGKRKGVTFGIYSSQQGKTDIFNVNRSVGVDVLLNYGNLNLDGEWSQLKRNIEGQKFNAETGHIRAGYNVIVVKKFFIEPTIAFITYHGDNGNQFSGKDQTYDFGVNWYLNKKNCKVALHYVKQDGFGNNTYTDGVTFKKGDFVGMAFVLML